jgi:single-strand DNA-binding protein
MLNRAMLIGHVGKDPEVRRLDNGAQVARFSLATSEKWRDRNTGEQKEAVEWHTIVVWGEGLVGVVDKYVRKGSRLYVEGKIQTRKWQDQKGDDRWSTEIVVSGMGGMIRLLDRKEGGGRRPEAPLEPPDDYSSSYAAAKNGSKSWRDDPLNDEIPF